MNFGSSWLSDVVSYHEVLLFKSCSYNFFAVELASLLCCTFLMHSLLSVVLLQHKGLGEDAITRQQQLIPWIFL